MLIVLLMKKCRFTFIVYAYKPCVFLRAVPVGDLFHLIDFKRVHWNLIFDILPTWSGMVSRMGDSGGPTFSQQLTPSSIHRSLLCRSHPVLMWLPLVWTWAKRSIQTENYLPLEFAIVRETEKIWLSFLPDVSNGILSISRTVMSGALCGMTGSYIFSQTIFTYRTGVHSKWIGFFIMLVFWYVVTSPINVLQMAPLFFFGATLIFIGYDLLYEWVRRGFTALPCACILFAQSIFSYSSLRSGTRSFFQSIVLFGQHLLRSKWWVSILVLCWACWWRL